MSSVITSLKTLEVMSLFVGSIISLIVCAVLVKILSESAATKRIRIFLYIFTLMEWFAVSFFIMTHLVHIYIDPLGIVNEDLLPIAVIALLVLLITKGISDILLVPTLMQIPINLHKRRSTGEIRMLRYGILFAHILLLSSWYALIAVMVSQNIVNSKGSVVLIYMMFVFVGSVSVIFFEDGTKKDIPNTEEFLPKISRWSVFTK